jgi:transposase InsO family protein
MKAHSQEFPVEKMATILGVSRCGYYEFLGRKCSKRALENQELTSEIKEVHKQSRGLYGSPRIHAELKKRGSSCSRKKVASLMKQEKIQAKMRKKWKRTTQPSKKVVEIAPNHLDQQFIVEEPNKVWVSDITYVWTAEGWLYVSIVLDLFSRKVVGLGMGNTLETELVTNALKQALYRRSIRANGLMHHSDRGCQYTSKEFRELSLRHGIQMSMSDKGHCYDNAVAESFFHTLKTEEVHLKHYRTREEAKTAIFEYVEVFYNRERLHSTLGYRSPKEFEEMWEKQKIEQIYVLNV